MQMLLFYCYHKSKLISALKTAEFSVNYFLKTVFCVRKGKFNDKFSVFFNTIFVYKSKYLKIRKSPTHKIASSRKYIDLRLQKTSGLYVGLLRFLRYFDFCSEKGLKIS